MHSSIFNILLTNIFSNDIFQFFNITFKAILEFQKVFHYFLPLQAFSVIYK